MRLRTATAALALAAAFGCASSTPMPVAAGETCFRCRRTINDARLAGEVIDAKGRAFKFRTAGCMAKYLKANPDVAAAVFVTDYPSGRLIKATSATFVPVVVVEGYTRTTDYRAYWTTATARNAAAEEKTAPIAWRQVLDAATIN